MPCNRGIPSLYMKLEVYYFWFGKELPKAHYPQARSLWKKPAESSKKLGL